MACSEGCADKEGLAVVAEFEGGPVFGDGVLPIMVVLGIRGLVKGFEAQGIEGCEGGFVVVA